MELPQAADWHPADGVRHTDGTIEYKIVAEFVHEGQNVFSRAEDYWEGTKEPLGYDHGLYEFEGDPKDFLERLAISFLRDVALDEGQRVIVRARIVTDIGHNCSHCGLYTVNEALWSDL